MVFLIAGASHTGKTALAQKILEDYGYPYLSIDHLKMGLIRSGYTNLTPEDDGKLVWVCPQCGNTDQSKMNVARRTCGYIGTQFWNQGRTQEIKVRVLHL